MLEWEKYWKRKTHKERKPQLCFIYPSSTLHMLLHSYHIHVSSCQCYQHGWRWRCSLPYFLLILFPISVFNIFFFFCYFFLKRKCVDENITRSAFVTAFVGSAVCTASAGFMTCTQRPLAVMMLCMCTFFLGLNRAGYTVNHIDLAPRCVLTHLYSYML